MNKGEKVIDILAEHPLTAKRICGKLIHLFLSFPVGNIYQNLETSCADTFINKKRLPKSNS